MRLYRIAPLRLFENSVEGVSIPNILTRSVSFEEISRFDFTQGSGSLDGAADDAGVHVASWEDVLFSSRRGDSYRTGPSRTDHAVPGQAPLAERRLQRTASGRRC